MLKPLLALKCVEMSEPVSPDVDHGHPRFDPAPDVRADLPMSLGSLPEIVPHLLVGPVQRALLLTGGPPCCTAPGGNALIIFSLYK